jgi:hypothetical protein
LVPVVSPPNPSDGSGYRTHQVAGRIEPMIAVQREDGRAATTTEMHVSEVERRDH